MDCLLSAFAGFAWLTHIVDCIIAHSWILLVVGTLIFPVGIVHGICVWFGIWA